jgi:chemotaxis protein MotB
MSAPAAPRKKRHHEEEHENHERWLVTYADMLTVLMALFIVMFAISVVDKNKFDALKAGMVDQLGEGQPSLLDGGSGLLDQPGVADGGMTMDVTAAAAALDEQQRRAGAVQQERADLEAARKKIAGALESKGMSDKVRFRIDERGLVVTLVTDDVLFDLGSAGLREQGRGVLDAIAPALGPLPNPVTVEGHTDDLPIRGRFTTNWELSTARATSVLRYLMETHQVPAARLSAAGYADQRPLVPNTPAQRATNRRVEVIVRAIAAAAAPPAVSAGVAPPVPVPVPAAPPHAAAAAKTEEKH